MSADRRVESWLLAERLWRRSARYWPHDPARWPRVHHRRRRAAGFRRDRRRTSRAGVRAALRTRGDRWVAERARWAQSLVPRDRGAAEARGQRGPGCRAAGRALAGDLHGDAAGLGAAASEAVSRESPHG